MALIVITTVDSQDAARKLSRSAVESSLAASGQVTGPIETTYRHLGDVSEGTEWQITFHTAADRRDALEEHIAAEHPYDSPEVIAFGIDAGRAEYLEWITRAAMAFAFRHLKLVVEPSGACALAAILARAVPHESGTIGVVLSGGGVDLRTFHRLITDAPHRKEPSRV
ncbi:divalent cation tolerance protein CutA [Streptomyces sp. NPDC094032]|uniref:divalent-cation tolerance protein CutA n=1 Tax=Streptomyces sp. NPDC094032 TaxID=3155308 RepID=UPI00332E3660